MLPKLAFALAAASLFAFAFLAQELPPVVWSAGLVWMAVLIAVLASGHRNALGVATGAIGALVGGLLLDTMPFAFGAVVTLGAFAERTLRVTKGTPRALAVGLAVVGGGAAASVVAAHVSATLPVLLVALVVASVLAALPMLVPAEDALAHTLARLAPLAPEPARAAILEGATLRRTWADLDGPRDAEKRVQPTWVAFLRLAEARVRLERTRASKDGAEDSAVATVAPALDERLREHVAVLAKTTLAVDAVRAASVTVDDAALAGAAQLGDALDAESRALVEVRQDA